MNGLRRGAVAMASAVALLGLSTLGVGAVQADESPGVPSSSVETPLERVNAMVQPSIVYLQQDWSGYVYDMGNKLYLNNGQPFQLTFQCTGFVVNSDGYVATAGHCVNQSEVLSSFYAAGAQWAVDNAYYVDPSLTVDDILAFQDYRVETMTKRNRADLVIQVGWGAAASGIETAQVKRARVIHSQATDAGDVALLKVEASDLNALPLSDQEVEVGTEVVSIGYPVSVDTVTDPDLTPSFKDGSISSVKTVQDGLLTVYEISAAVSGGMSGGPTVNLDGEVVGVNSFGITGESQAFNFVRPSGQVTELLADAGVDNVLSDTTRAYRDGLSAFWAGDRTVAVEKLSLVVEAQPSNQLAVEYLGKAKALPKPKPADTGSGSSLVTILVVGGVVLLAGALVAVLVLRRRKGAPPVAAPRGAPVGGPPFPAQAPAGTPGRAATPVTVPAAAPLAQPSPTKPIPLGPAADEPETPRFCGNCGAHSHPHEKFCEQCGEPLLH